MNLKEIQDNAPDGATHFANACVGKGVYFKKENDLIFCFDNSANGWDLIIDTYLFIFNKYAQPLYPTQESKNPTNPSHYKQGKVECIDAIESALVGKKGIEASLVGNIIKYLWRYEEKNGVEDVEKAKWYLEKLLEKLRC